MPTKVGVADPNHPALVAFRAKSGHCYDPHKVKSLITAVLAGRNSEAVEIATALAD